MRIPRPIAEKIGRSVAATYAETGRLRASDLRRAVKEATRLPWAEVDKLLGSEETFVDQNVELRDWFERDLHLGLIAPEQIGVAIHTGKDGYMVVVEVRDQAVGRDMVRLAFVPSSLDMALEKGFERALWVLDIIKKETGIASEAPIVVHPLTVESQRPSREETLTLQRVQEAMQKFNLDRAGAARVVVMMQADELVQGPYNMTIQPIQSHMEPIVVTGPELEAHLMKPLGLLGLLGDLRGGAFYWHSEELPEAGVAVSAYRHGTLKMNRRTKPIGFPLLTRPTALYSESASIERFVVMAQGEGDFLGSEDLSTITTALQTITGASSSLCLSCYTRQNRLLQQALRTHSLRRYLAAFGLIAAGVRATAPTRD